MTLTLLRGMLSAVIFIAVFLGGVWAASKHYQPLLDTADDKVSALTEDNFLANRAVEKLNTDSKARKQAADASVERAKGEAQARFDDALKLRSLPLPAGTDACTAACALLDSQIKP